MKKARIEAPATSANLGPGFDALALALDLTDIVTVELDEESDEVALVAVSGDFALPVDRTNNLLCRAYKTFGDILLGLKASPTRDEQPTSVGEDGAPSGSPSSDANEPSAPKKLPGARFSLECRIPPARGLGSSAASIAAGLVTANWALQEKALCERMLQMATEMEGHPDNVAAALLGGLTVAFRDGQMVRAMHVVNHLEMGVALFVPNGELRTTEARSCLPDQVPLSSAVFDLGRLAYLVTAFIWGRWEELGPAMEDRLHQPYRARILPALDNVIGAAREAGAYGASLSGSGPTVIALTPVCRTEAVAAAMEKEGHRVGWMGSSRTARVRERGTQLQEIKDGEPDGGSA